MMIWIALLRGVNVGGHNKLPMKALQAIIEAQGAKDASTYIQSGNIVFRSPRMGAGSLQKKFGSAIKSEFGFEPDIIIIDIDAFRTVINNNPFAAVCDDPSKQHVIFLKQRVDGNALKEVKRLLSNSEQVKAAGSTIYFHAPSGVGRSKAAEKLFRLFPGGTMRNWRTCVKLEEMAGALSRA